ncbi:hypothetical protein [Halobacillus karajensis]|nr:hypothetical protein [Halobacillus karajensis]CDQ21688.1 hypothetical protein BN982_04097 [Halobacillus karajensis]
MELVKTTTETTYTIRIKQSQLEFLADHAFDSGDLETYSQIQKILEGEDE